MFKPFYLIGKGRLLNFHYWFWRRLNLVYFYWIDSFFEAKIIFWRICSKNFFIVFAIINPFDVELSICIFSQWVKRYWSHLCINVSVSKQQFLIFNQIFIFGRFWEFIPVFCLWASILLNESFFKFWKLMYEWGSDFKIRSSGI